MCIAYAIVCRAVEAVERAEFVKGSCSSQEFDDFLVFNPTLSRGSTAFSASLMPPWTDLIVRRPDFQIFNPLNLPQEHRTMWILPLLGYVGIVLGFAFLTLAIGMQSPTSEEDGVLLKTCEG